MEVVTDYLSMILFMQDHFEPEPVEDLDGADDREACEQTHHSTNPGYFVWQGHLGVSFDLQYYGQG